MNPHPRHSIRLRGGPRDGETHEVDILGARVLMPGNWEDRRLSGFTPEGTPLYDYPTVVYKIEADMLGLMGGEVSYRYDRTDPA